MFLNIKFLELETFYTASKIATCKGNYEQWSSNL